jgi:hypothetical protein
VDVHQRQPDVPLAPHKCGPARGPALSGRTSAAANSGCSPAWSSASSFPGCRVSSASACAVPSLPTDKLQETKGAKEARMKQLHTQVSQKMAKSEALCRGHPQVRFPSSTGSQTPGAANHFREGTTSRTACAELRQSWRLKAPSVPAPAKAVGGSNLALRMLFRNHCCLPNCSSRPRSRPKSACERALETGQYQCRMTLEASQHWEHAINTRMALNEKQILPVVRPSRLPPRLKFSDPPVGGEEILRASDGKKTNHSIHPPFLLTFLRRFMTTTETMQLTRPTRAQSSSQPWPL